MPQSRHDASISKTVRLYRIIEAYIKANHHPPSFEDLVTRGAFTSSFMVHWHISRLKGWKLLESKPRLSRTISLHPISSAPADVQKYFEGE